jgi:hypothetical protein
MSFSNWAETNLGSRGVKFRSVVASPDSLMERRPIGRPLRRLLRSQTHGHVPLNSRGSAHWTRHLTYRRREASNPRNLVFERPLDGATFVAEMRKPFNAPKGSLLKQSRCPDLNFVQNNVRLMRSIGGGLSSRHAVDNDYRETHEFSAVHHKTYDNPGRAPRSHQSVVFCSVLLATSFRDNHSPRAMSPSSLRCVGPTQFGAGQLRAQDMPSCAVWRGGVGDAGVRLVMHFDAGASGSSPNGLARRPDEFGRNVLTRGELCD